MISNNFRIYTYMYDVERFRSFLFNSTNHSWYRYILSLFFSNNNLIISTEENQISIEFRARLNLSFLIPCPKFSKHFRRATLVSMYREKSINTSRRKLKERPNSTVILLCITLTSQFKTRYRRRPRIYSRMAKLCGYHSSHVSKSAKYNNPATGN